ncbi:MAG: GerMN domain-containing protein [Actinomycetota bacterium]
MATVALLALAACGRAEVTVLSEGELPRDVYGSPVPTPTPSLELPSRGTVYFVERGSLVEVQRTLQGVATSEAAALLLALFQDPGDLPGRVHSAIPPDTRLNSVTISGGTARVDLSAEFGRGGSGRELQLRVAQVVYTVTENEQISSVHILIEGQARGVPRPGAGVTFGPVARSDYEEFAPAGD